MATVAEARVTGARRARGHARRGWVGLLFVLPSAAFIGLFFVVPLAMTAWISLHDWPLLGDARFIGLRNYRTLASDSTFWGSLRFTTEYTLIVTPVIFLLAFGLALLVQRRVRGVGFFRTAFFLPVVIGLSTASLLWVWLFNDQVGVFDGVLPGSGLIKEPIEWLGDPTSALLSTGAMVIWKTVGFTMILFVVGLQAIPTQLYEAAMVDGAGRWARLRHITVPLLRRTFALALVLAVIASFLAFDQFYIMTQGGPQNQTLTVVYWIYANSFTYFKLGYGAALSIVLLAILIVLSTIQLYLLRDDTQY